MRRVAISTTARVMRGNCIGVSVEEIMGTLNVTVNFTTRHSSATAKQSCAVGEFRGAGGAK